MRHLGWINSSPRRALQAQQALLEHFVPAYPALHVPRERLRGLNFIDSHPQLSLRATASGARTGTSSTTADASCSFPALLRRSGLRVRSGTRTAADPERSLTFAGASGGTTNATASSLDIGLTSITNSSFSSSQSSSSSSSTTTPKSTNSGSSATNSVKPTRTYLLLHGFGSGLGFFFPTMDSLLADPKNRVIAVDWLGMGASERPNVSELGHVTRVPLIFPKCRFNETEAVDFFIDSLHQWRIEYGLQDTELDIVGHSLGGYLSARYVMKYPKSTRRLVLVSPAGLPEPPKSTPQPAGKSVKTSSLRTPAGLRLIDVLWTSNVTPQSLIRMMGPRGEGAVQNVVRRRFQGSFEGERASPGLSKIDEKGYTLIGSYLYHITVQKASGEYALNSILKPFLGTGRPHIYTRQPLQTLLREKEFPVETTIVFGDHDWLATERAVHTATDLEANAKKRNVKLRIIRGGHHLYLDNPDALHQILISN